MSSILELSLPTEILFPKHDLLALPLTHKGRIPYTSQNKEQFFHNRTPRFAGSGLSFSGALKRASH
jgi:hypothetical protein